MNRTVVVGVEGSASSHDALLWAARAADARSDELEIVHAFGIPYATLDAVYDDAITQGAEGLLAAEAERALQEAPGLTIRTTLSPATPAAALTSASTHAALVVVGSRPLGTVERFFAGSLSYQIVAGAHCPVLLVPQGADDTGTGVVVGSDGSADAIAAIAVAAQEADRLGQELTVLHAWQSRVTYVSADIASGLPDTAGEERERAVLAESVAGLGERYPDLVVHQALVQRHPAQALLEAGQGAKLLVVGSRGLNGVARMLLGSVSHTVVVHAPCAVLVVRA